MPPAETLDRVQREIVRGGKLEGLSPAQAGVVALSRHLVGAVVWAVPITGQHTCSAAAASCLPAGCCLTPEGLLHARACVACIGRAVQANPRLHRLPPISHLHRLTLPAKHDPALCPGTLGATPGATLQSPVHPVVPVHRPCRPCCASQWPPCK